jgi:hypothetical protein
MSLLDAAYCLDELAGGRVPGRPQLLSGALALDTLCRNGAAERELLDAAAGLNALATGGTPDLAPAGQARAALLAAAVRREMTRG